MNDNHEIPPHKAAGMVMQVLLSIFVPIAVLAAIIFGAMHLMGIWGLLVAGFGIPIVAVYIGAIADNRKRR